MNQEPLNRALALVRPGPYRNWPASGVLTGPIGRDDGREADFLDHGLAFAVAEILNAVNDGRLVRSDAVSVARPDMPAGRRTWLPGGWSCYCAGDAVHFTHPTAGDVFTMHVGRCWPEFQDFIAALAPGHQTTIVGRYSLERLLRGEDVVTEHVTLIPASEIMNSPHRLVEEEVFIPRDFPNDSKAANPSPDPA